MDKGNNLAKNKKPFKRALEKIKLVWRTYPFVATLAVFVSLFILFSAFYIPASGISARDDHFFHFKFAELLRQQDWMPQIISNGYIFLMSPKKKRAFQFLFFILP